MHLWNDSRAHGRPHPTSPYKNKAWLRIDVKNQSGHIGRIRIEVRGYGWVTFFHGNKPSFPVRHVSGHALLDSQGLNRIKLIQQKTPKQSLPTPQACCLNRWCWSLTFSNCHFGKLSFYEKLRRIVFFSTNCRSTKWKFTNIMSHLDFQ